MPFKRDCSDRTLTTMDFNEFSEISAGDSAPRYHNFLAHFIEGRGIANDIYQNTPHFKELKKTNPELVATLTNAIRGLPRENLDRKLNSKIERLLFKAYQTMRQLGASDNDLGISEG